MKRFDIPDLANLRSELKSNMISQLALSKMSGVSQSVISRIIDGKIRDPSYGTVVKLLHALNLLNNYDGIVKHQDNSKTAKDVMSKRVASVKPHDTLQNAWEIMKHRNFSQIPVIDGRGRVIGSVTEALLAEYDQQLDHVINETLYDDPFPAVGENAELITVANILKTTQAVLVVKRGKVLGIITRYDLIEKRTTKSE